MRYYGDSILHRLFIGVHNKYFKGEDSNTPWAVVDLNVLKM